ncbi:trypsin-like serine protease [Mariprofundus erugo]|uniref:Trypsin-like serine protease n=1 Tax=Mariprofundus erugo TaxID=2528639 RepID=A0A5R9GR47_9PROT|nr:tetratricopeptide repeat-containing serine protease family protein [Mariprofundus erugo]TLS66492.1 trypsin-like serine protease [Mariprofundus erugo]
MKLWCCGLVMLVAFLCPLFDVLAFEKSSSDRTNDVTECQKLFAEKKYQEAHVICRALADSGDADSQLILGVMYNFGQGVETNYSEALSWYRKSALQGNAWAQLNLSGIYSIEKWQYKNSKEAIKWARMAAEQGLAPAQYNLAEGYAKGNGVKQDYFEATKWYRKAAEQNDSDAQFKLGVMYLKGEGVTKDYAQAVIWLQKAAENNHVEAQYTLGRVYLQPEMQFNFIEARKWLTMALKAGYEKAEEPLLFIATLAPEDISDWNIDHPEKYIIHSSKENFSYFDSTKVKNTSRGVLAWITVQERINLKQKYVMTALVRCDEFSFAILSGSTYSEDGASSVEIDKINFETPKPDSGFSRLIEKTCSSSVASAEREKIANSVSFGTGWHVSGSYVVTNNHVIDGHSKITLIMSDGTEVPAVVAIKDGVNDLAILKVSDNSKMHLALSLAHLPARIGERVFTIGYPHPTTMGAKPKLTDGTISALSGLKDDPRVYQISVPLQAGNSGGPLINMNGEVVGIVTAKLSAGKMYTATGDLTENVNYAVKSHYLSALLSSVPTGISSSTVSTKESASLADIADEVKDSVMIVIAE